MQGETGTIRIRKSTIVLSVVLILLIVSSVYVFAIHPSVHRYYIMHRKYEIYGGMNDELKDSDFYEDMESGRSFCFLGDSITYGSVTEGIHWYQPLIPYISGEISQYSHSGWTVTNIIEHIDNIPEVEIYVIAIGINDILYPDHDDSAHTASEFVIKCDLLADLLTDRYPDSKIYFIAPWSFIDNDVSFIERGNQFRTALEGWYKDTDYHYINPNTIILSVIASEGPVKYMYNDFHPNAPRGVGLFSYAVLQDAHNRRLENK